MNRVLLELLLLKSFYRQTLFVKQGEKNATDKIWKHSIKEGQLNLTSAFIICWLISGLDRKELSEWRESKRERAEYV